MDQVWLTNRCLASMRTRTSFNMLMDLMKFELRSPLQYDSIVDSNCLEYDL